MQKLKCPITLQYFRNPVVASDGQIYEKTAINEWIKIYARSPITQGPINPLTYPCMYVKDGIETLESTELFFYMKRYQLDIKNWLIDYMEKYDIVMTQRHEQIINGINVTELTETIIDFFSEININKHSDQININSCKMPDRIILYDFLINHLDTKKVIKETSPDDQGLRYYFTKIICGLKAQADTQIFDILDPETHFKLLDYNGFQHYVQHFDHLDQFLDSINHNLGYFDETVRPFLLHCFLSNHLLWPADLNKSLNTFNKMTLSKHCQHTHAVENIIQLVAINYNQDPNNRSVTSYMPFCDDNNNHNNYFLIVQTLKCLMKNNQFVTNLSGSDIILICKYIKGSTELDPNGCDPNYFVSQLLKKSQLHNDILKTDTMIHIFSNLDQCLYRADLFIHWLISKNIDLNSLYDGKTIFSHYLYNANCVGTDEHFFKVCSNIRYFVEYDILINPSDLSTIANILILNKKKIIDGLFILNLHFYVNKHFNTREREYIECVIIWLKKYYIDHATMCKIIVNHDIRKKQLLSVNGVCMGKDYSMVQGILINPVIDQDMIKLIIQKYPVFENEWLEYLLKNPKITIEIIEMLPKDITVSDKVLKIAANNENVTLKILRSLINKK